MERNIAARFAARPAARFPRPSTRLRERQLGLRHPAAFRAGDGRVTVLRDGSISGVASLRRAAGTITATRPRRPVSGRPRPNVSVTWSRTLSLGPARAVPAPWHA